MDFICSVAEFSPHINEMVAGIYAISNVKFIQVKHTYNMTLMFHFQVCGVHIDAIAKNDINNIEVVGSQEPLGQIICKISYEVISHSVSLSGKLATSQTFPHPFFKFCYSRCFANALVKGICMRGL